MFLINHRKGSSGQTEYKARFPGSTQAVWFPVQRIETSVVQDFEHRLNARNQRKDALSDGFKVSGSRLESLNGDYKPKGKYKGSPLYKAVKGAAGLYKAKGQDLWLFHDEYSKAAADESRCDASFASVDGRVPLGDFVWDFGTLEDPEKSSITLVALKGQESQQESEPEESDEELSDEDKEEEGDKTKSIEHELFQNSLGLVFV